MSKTMAAIIPARGGSKRLPGKNIKPFAGRPLIEWSINFALRCQAFDAIVVSTDDQQIASVARRAGAEIVWRPVELSTDFSPTIAAVTHAYENHRTMSLVDCVCVLQPTNPLRPRCLVDEVKKIELPDEQCSMMTVSRSHLKLGKITESGIYAPLTYSLGQRSQDMDILFYENGLLYLTPSKLIKDGKLFGDRVFALETDKRFSVDIDNIYDFEIGELLFQKNRSDLTYLL